MTQVFAEGSWYVDTEVRQELGEVYPPLNDVGIVDAEEIGASSPTVEPLWRERFLTPTDGAVNYGRR